MLGLSFVVGLLTITRPPKQNELLRSIRNDLNASDLNNKILTHSSLVSSNQIGYQKLDKQDVTIWQCIKTPQFILLFIMMYCSSFYGYLVINQYKDFGQITLKDDHFLTIVGAFSGFRFTWSFLMQKNTHSNLYIR